ncbi:SWIM zinc finger family protein [Umezawaea sp. Da 62-37]|uniref:SWIM zinc finger family protein n=1 Tax=Umezawaea sp. Da 62-37 TaxID=3075927 RepID=UPI0028F72FC6|nr:SWIM zinc finger family protein [Umezawaea sp. Da 62-37]WNV91537.1 SWIM zinc finger family protein [Umezawaea sp. Da 62-37]
MDAQAVLEQAPDGQVASSATRLAATAGWSGTGRTAALLWGLCAGSGKNPYRVCVDLGDRSTKCSCPSRKFPCKHAVALQLVHVRGDVPVADAPPDWAEDWHSKRTAAAVPVDSSPEAVERRARAKEKTARGRAEAVRGGVAALRDWLSDLAGSGVAGLPGRDAAWWHSITARMVDAQAPGLVSAVAGLREVVAAGGPQWAVDAADRLGGLHLLAGLSEGAEGPLGDVVRARLGFPVPEEQVRASAGWSDRWVALLRLETDDGVVRTVRQWSWGRDLGEWVVGVRYAAGVASPAPSLPHGREVTGTLHPYPGVPPRRIAVGELVGDRSAEAIPVPTTWREALAGLEPALRADPWQRVHPLGCAAVRPTADVRFLVDVARRALPVRGDAALDRALALTGGEPFDAWGLWDGHGLRVGAVAEPGKAPEVVG